jgi:hypothetical protein
MVDIRKLPQPNEAFAWLQAAAGPALVCRPLEQVAPHLFTTRHWSLGAQDDQGEGAKWGEVAEAIGCAQEDLVRVNQVHGNGVLIARERTKTVSDADIILSSDPALGLAVRSADCVPLLIADRRTGAVAAAHSGWRGIAARVAETTVGALAGEFGSRPGDLMAAAGPSIGASCYEVGADVKERFAARFDAADLARWFSPARRADHWLFDQWRATRDQLAAAGIDPSRIFIAELCTASHPDVFCSYRRDGSGAGRLAGAIRPARRPWRRSPGDRRGRSARGRRARM